MTVEEALALVGRIDARYRRVWDALPPRQQAALAMYFLPHRSRRDVLAPTRPRVIKWYCPFADQRVFPSGHRYVINVYAGCGHGCVYCYAAAYEPQAPAPKADFRRRLLKDLEELEEFDVPPAPVHLSNSTDPFQPLEEHLGHTRFALEQICAHRRRFSSVVILTRNPPGTARHIDLLHRLAGLPADHPRAAEMRAGGMAPLVVEASVAFRRDEAAAFYDRCAPSIEQRVAGLRALRDAGIPIVLRIDPLFPPLDGADGLPQAQTAEDLRWLVNLAAELRVRHVVWSVAKIVQPRMRPVDSAVAALRRAFERFAAPRRLVFRGGAWRLPPEAAAQVSAPFLEMCRSAGVKALHCMRNLIETP